MIGTTSWNSQPRIALSDIITFTTIQHHRLMTRKITADEVRHFMEACDKQFREAGFFLNSIHFKRTDYDTPPNIILNYEEKETDSNQPHANDTDEQHL